MSTAKTICAEFERSLLRLKDQFIKFPMTRQELQDLMDEFEEEYGIPQIVGAIDGCHIEINAPPDNHEDYLKIPASYSVQRPKLFVFVGRETKRKKVVVRLLLNSFILLGFFIMARLTVCLTTFVIKTTVKNGPKV